jgi:TRAP-type C4-dicarboxylate transport system substrate-binding protein
VALPEQYMAIQKGTADGSWSEWGTFAPYKLWEVLSYSIDPGLKSIALIAVMNKDTYNQMPQDIQQIVDEMISSKKYVDWACQINFDVTSAARQEVLDRGGEITEWSAEDWDQIATNLAPAWQEWLSNIDSKGLDGQKVLDEGYKIMKDLGIENPAIGYEP